MESAMTQAWVHGSAHKGCICMCYMTNIPGYIKIHKAEQNFGPKSFSALFVLFVVSVPSKFS